MSPYHQNSGGSNTPEYDLFGKLNTNTIEARYPESPGSKGPPDGTSAAAARAIAPSVKRCHSVILQELASAGDRGLTTDECAKLLERSPLFIRPRFSELKRQGAIEPAGIRRPNDSGLMAMAFRAAGASS